MRGGCKPPPMSARLKLKKFRDSVDKKKAETPPKYTAEDKKKLFRSIR